VARVALEVVDSAWWKQQLRVKSAGSRTTALSSNEGAFATIKRIYAELVGPVSNPVPSLITLSADLFAYRFRSRSRVVYLAQYFLQLLLQHDFCRRTSLASEPRDKVLHSYFMLYGRLLDKNGYRCEALTDISHPVILLQGGESRGDRFIESLRGDLYGVLNVSNILYRNCARSKNHVQKRSIFAFCSPEDQVAITS